MKKILAPVVATLLSAGLAVGLFALCSRAYGAPPGMIKVVAIVAFAVAGTTALVFAGIGALRRK